MESEYMKATIISMIIVLCMLAVIPMFMIGDNNILAHFDLGRFGIREEAPKTPENITNVTTNKKFRFIAGAMKTVSCNLPIHRRWIRGRPRWSS